MQQVLDRKWAKHARALCREQSPPAFLGTVMDRLRKPQGSARRQYRCVGPWLGRAAGPVAEQHKASPVTAALSSLSMMECNSQDYGRSAANGLRTWLQGVGRDYSHHNGNSSLNGCKACKRCVGRNRGGMDRTAHWPAERRLWPT